MILLKEEYRIKQIINLHDLVAILPAEFIMNRNLTHRAADMTLVFVVKEQGYDIP